MAPYDEDLCRVEAGFAVLLTGRYKTPSEMKTTELKSFCKKRKLNLSGISEKSELVQLVTDSWADECPICLAEFKEGEFTKQTFCGHVFHWSCLGEAVLAKASTVDAPRTGPIECPVCRYVLFTQTVPFSMATHHTAHGSAQN